MYTPEEFTNNMRSFGDPTYPYFRGWPTSTQSAAAEWADLLDSATATLVPTVLPAVRIAAKNTLQQQLAILFTAGAGEYALPAALQVYVVALVPGMLPNFAGLPPPVPLNLAPLLALKASNPTAERAMTVMGLLVMNWLRTGTAINVQTDIIVNWY